MATASEQIAKLEAMLDRLNECPDRIAGVLDGQPDDVRQRAREVAADGVAPLADILMFAIAVLRATD